MSDFTFLLEKTISDSSPLVYDELASTYDEVMSSVSYVAPKGAVSIWFETISSSLTDGAVHKVFDAGSGTGLVGEEIAKYNNSSIEVFGGDLSPVMLDTANNKKVYTDLKIVNLKEELPYKEESFDSAICVGLFLQGHLGTECLPNIFRVLKKDGYFIASTREDFYEEDKWIQSIEDNGCVLLDKRVISLHKKSKGIVLIIQKK